MKSLMKLAIACLLLNVGCSNSVSYDEALAKNQEQFEDASMIEDATFLVDSKSRSMLAIELLTFATASGYSSAVVSFAKQTLPEHQKLNEEIEDLSDEKNITLPDALSDGHQKLLSELTSVSRQDFDRTFSGIMSRINDENNSIFTTKATRASDPDIRAFAARKLDLLRAHSKLLSEMQSQLLDTSD